MSEKGSTTKDVLMSKTLSTFDGLYQSPTHDQTHHQMMGEFLYHNEPLAREIRKIKKNMLIADRKHQSVPPAQSKAFDRTASKTGLKQLLQSNSGNGSQNRSLQQLKAVPPPFKYNSLSMANSIQGYIKPSK